MPKAKAEVTLQQQQPKADVKAVEKVGQPKSGGQSQSLLSIAGIKVHLVLSAIRISAWLERI